MLLLTIQINKKTYIKGRGEHLELRYQVILINIPPHQVKKFKDKKVSKNKLIKRVDNLVSFLGF